MQGAMLAARLVLGSVFFVSGLSKLRFRDSLVEGILQYELATVTQARFLALALPPLELMLGILLVVGVGLVITSIASLLLLLVFTVAIVINLRRGREFPCHCFGSGHANIGGEMLVRNVMLVASALFVSIAGLVVRPADDLAIWHAYEPAQHPSELVALLTAYTLSLAMVFLLGEVDISLLFSNNQGETRGSDRVGENSGKRFGKHA